MFLRSPTSLARVCSSRRQPERPKTTPASPYCRVRLCASRATPSQKQKTTEGCSSPSFLPATQPGAVLTPRARPAAALSPQHPGLRQLPPGTARSTGDTCNINGQRNAKLETEITFPSTAVRQVLIYRGFKLGISQGDSNLLTGRWNFLFINLQYICKIILRQLALLESVSKVWCKYRLTLFCSLLGLSGRWYDWEEKEHHTFIFKIIITSDKTYGKKRSYVLFVCSNDKRMQSNSNEKDALGRKHTPQMQFRAF